MGRDRQEFPTKSLRREFRVAPNSFVTRKSKIENRKSKIKNRKSSLPRRSGPAQFEGGKVEGAGAVSAAKFTNQLRIDHAVQVKVVTQGRPVGVRGEAGGRALARHTQDHAAVGGAIRNSDGPSL